MQHKIALIRTLTSKVYNAIINILFMSNMCGFNYFINNYYQFICSSNMNKFTRAKKSRNQLV